MSSTSRSTSSSASSSFSEIRVLSYWNLNAVYVQYTVFLVFVIGAFVWLPLVVRLNLRWWRDNRGNSAAKNEECNSFLMMFLDAEEQRRCVQASAQRKKEAPMMNRTAQLETGNEVMQNRIDALKEQLRRIEQQAFQTEFETTIDSLEKNRKTQELMNLLQGSIEEYQLALDHFRESNASLYQSYGTALDTVNQQFVGLSNEIVNKLVRIAYTPKVDKYRQRLVVAYDRITEYLEKVHEHLRPVSRDQWKELEPRFRRKQ